MEQTALEKESTLAPLVEDMGIYLIAGRTYDPGQAITQGVEAERLGFRRVFLSERFDLKEAGALLGGVSALTTRLEVGTGIAACGARHPLITAAMAATMQAAYGHRFFLGLGRSSGPYLQGQSMEEFGYQAFEDYCGIVRRLLKGETVSYDGPAGHYEALRTVDACPPPLPEVWTSTLGGPRASKVAARAGDGVLLAPFLTVDAVATAARTIRAERERVGLDPSVTICHPIVVAPELDGDYTRAISAARFLTYVVGMPAFAKAYLERNRWDGGTMKELLDHPQFRSMERATADQSFHREELMEAAKRVPEKWMRETCALGSVAECVATLRAFRNAGVDELALYGSTPADNAKLIAAWRDDRSCSRRR